MKGPNLIRNVGRVLPGLCLFAVAACSSSSSAPPPPAPPNPAVVADLAAFDKNPNPSTWLPVHADIVTVSPNTYQGAVLRTLGSGRVPPRIVNDAVVDLGAIDWVGTMKWLRDINIGARSASDTVAIRNSAKLTWMMFSLRSSWATDFVDLTRMDLRAPSPYLAPQVNLNNVNFGQALLTGSTWVGTSLLNSSFDGAVIDGPLYCTACSWGSSIVPSTLKYQYGKWVAR